MSEQVATIPSMEEFLDKLYSIYPLGNAEQIYQLLPSYLNSKLITGEVLTFDLLCKRYAEYISYLKPYNEIKDKQYIAKDKKYKHIGGYLIDKMFNQDYGALSFSPTDDYLYGIPQ